MLFGHLAAGRGFPCPEQPAVLKGLGFLVRMYFHDHLREFREWLES